MKRAPWLVSIIALFGHLTCADAAEEVLRWERLPLPVRLLVDQERVIFMDRAVRVGLPANLGERLRVQNVDGAIYLRASEPIASSRVQIQDTESGRQILLDISAEPAKENEAPLKPLRIVDAIQPTPNKDDHPDRSPPGPRTARPGESSSGPPDATPAAVALTRYAAQNLYAPLRTVEPVSGIRSAPVRDIPTTSLLPSLPVHARAVAAWRLGEYWVSAVRIVNTSSRWLALDPRALQGDFVAATFQHPTLGPKGKSTDTSVVYLVTRGRGLAASLPVIAPMDATINLPSAAPLDSPVRGAGDAQ